MQDEPIGEGGIKLTCLLADLPPLPSARMSCVLNCCLPQCMVAFAAGRLAAAQRARAAGKPRSTALAPYAQDADARRVPERLAATPPRRLRGHAPRSLARRPPAARQQPTVRFWRVRERATWLQGEVVVSEEHRDRLSGFAGPG